MIDDCSVSAYILVYHRAANLLPDILKGTNRKGKRLYIHGWKTKYLDNQVTKEVRGVRANLLNCLLNFRPEILILGKMERKIQSNIYNTCNQTL